MADIEEARRTFDRFDANGDGFVTPVEFQQAMIALGDKFYTVSTAEAIVASRDTNKDGVLSFEEFFQHGAKHV